MTHSVYFCELQLGGLLKCGNPPCADEDYKIFVTEWLLQIFVRMQKKNPNKTTAQLNIKQNPGFFLLSFLNKREDGNCYLFKLWPKHNPVVHFRFVFGSPINSSCIGSAFTEPRKSHATEVAFGMLRLVLVR